MKEMVFLSEIRPNADRSRNLGALRYFDAIVLSLGERSSRFFWTVNPMQEPQFCPGFGRFCLGYLLCSFRSKEKLETLTKDTSE